MKKVSLYVFLALMICNIAPSQSSLSECEGNDKNISSFSVEHFAKVRKWTNCQGTTVGPKGEKYVGEFSNGKFHGQGTFTHAGRKYVGQYKNHKKHGQGTYKYANGDKYVGNWKKGLRHGKGIFTYANGKVEEGIWKKDKLVKLKQ